MSSSVKSEQSKKSSRKWYDGGSIVKGGGSSRRSGNSRSGNSRSGNSRSDRPRRLELKEDTMDLMEMKGQLFMYGVPDQAERFITGCKALGQYVGCEISLDMNGLVVDRTELVFKEPTRPDKDSAAPGEWKMFEILWNENRKEERKYKNDKGRVFMMIMTLCHSSMEIKVQNEAKFSTWKRDADVVALLDKMDDLVFSGDDAQYPLWKLQASIRKWAVIQQEPREKDQDYMDRYMKQVKATEKLWGALIPQNMKGKAILEQEAERRKFLACHMAGGFDRTRHRRGIDELNNRWMRKKEEFPADAGSMVAYMSNRRGGGSESSKRMDALQDGIAVTSFMQNGKSLEDVICYKCQQRGHYAHECPVKKKGDDSDDESISSKGSTDRSKSGNKKAVNHKSAFLIDDDEEGYKSEDSLLANW